MDRDDDIAEHKKSSYRGRAKIHLRNFSIGPGPRSIRGEHIRALVRIFESEGCSRLNPENWVKVLVPSDIEFDVDINDDRFVPLLDLDENIRFTVLQGKHRLLAAKTHSVDWWIAEFYSEDLHPQAKQALAEYHPNAQRFCDGDIYRNIRYYQGLGDVDAEVKWRGRLSKKVQHDLARMEKDFKYMQRAFDMLLDFTPLWNTLKLSYLGRWLTLKCPEELTRYLDTLHSQWSYIMAGYPESLDEETINILETLMPSISFNDQAIIRQSMIKGHIFTKITDPKDREVILARVLNTSGRILSFYTFTQDAMFFEACALTLKQLQPPGSKRSMLEGFRKSLEPDSNLCYIQVSESKIDSRDWCLDRARLGYQQLFLAVMRDFPTLTNMLPYQDNRKVKPKPSGFQPERICNLARLATFLGFQNEEIKAIREDTQYDQYTSATENFILRIKPPDRYEANLGSNREIAELVAEAISATPALEITLEKATFTCDLEKQPKKNRCNRPTCLNYHNDRNFLFLEILFGTDITPGFHATSLAFQRDIFVCFFGYPEKIVGSTNENLHSNSLGVNSAMGQEEVDPTIEVEFTSVSDSAVSNSEDYLSIDLRETSDSRYDSQINQVEFSRQSESSFHSISTNSPIHDVSVPLLFLTPHEKPSVCVHDMLQKDNIILYLWPERQYAKFSLSDEEIFFQRIARAQANQGKMFISWNNGRAMVLSLERIFEIAKRDRFILALPKSENSKSDSRLLSRLQSGFLTFIDQ